ncbi:hypothetical protein VTI74DRAFT_7962 [Chaetomium olivicolor]
MQNDTRGRGGNQQEDATVLACALGARSAEVTPPLSAFSSSSWNDQLWHMSHRSYGASPGRNLSLESRRWSLLDRRKARPCRLTHSKLYHVAAANLNSKPQGQLAEPPPATEHFDIWPIPDRPGACSGRLALMPPCSRCFGLWCPCI